MTTFGQVREGIDRLRSLEVSLYRAHSEEQAYLRDTYGIKEFDGSEPTNHSLAADALENLLNALEDILTECEYAETTAVVMGDHTGTTAKIRVDFLLNTLGEYLPKDDDDE